MFALNTVILTIIYLSLRDKPGDVPSNLADSVNRDSGPATISNNKGAREEYSAENMDVNLQLYFRLSYIKVYILMQSVGIYNMH